MAYIYRFIDQSSLLRFLFYPRRQHQKARDGAFDLAVPVDSNVDILCRVYPAEPANCWILYFHGNGEVVSDYDTIAPAYTAAGINLLVADYRGYGASGGTPTFKNMVDDAGVIFEYALKKFSNDKDVQELSWLVMGRSLGSISALELAAKYPGQLKGLIIESGFLSVDRLVRHLGLPDPGNLTSIEDYYRKLATRIVLPALVLHGEWDRLVPYEQGRELFDVLGSKTKKMVRIEKADHNNIMFVDRVKYIQEISNFISETGVR
jgi:hypothetical protein